MLRSKRMTALYGSTFPVLYYLCLLTVQQTEKELAAELKTYDLKVHAAAVKMADALAAELRGMDIPFFTLRKDLVKDAPNAGDSVQSKASTAAASSSITKPELLDLQNRMLGLLEDLCKE